MRAVAFGGTGFDGWVIAGLLLRCSIIAESLPTWRKDHLLFPKLWRSTVARFADYDLALLADKKKGNLISLAIEEA